MWQLFALGSQIFSAAEEVVDKVIIVSDMAINSIVATFYRNLIYFAIAALIGATGILGPMRLLISWPIVIVGALSVGTALFYTYMLKHVELTGSMALSYSRPIVFYSSISLLLKPHSAVGKFSACSCSSSAA